MAMDSTGIASRSILKVGCGLAAMVASVAVNGPASPYPPPSVSVWVSLSMCLLRTDLQNAGDCLHERGIVGLGDDPARGEEADDHIGQLVLAQGAGSDRGHRVEGVPQSQHQLAA